MSGRGNAPRTVLPEKSDLCLVRRAACAVGRANFLHHGIFTGEFRGCRIEEIGRQKLARRAHGPGFYMPESRQQAAVIGFAEGRLRAAGIKHWRGRPPAQRVAATRVALEIEIDLARLGPVIGALAHHKAPNPAAPLNPQCFGLAVRKSDEELHAVEQKRLLEMFGKSGCRRHAIGDMRVGALRRALNRITAFIALIDAVDGKKSRNMAHGQRPRGQRLRDQLVAQRL